MLQRLIAALLGVLGIAAIGLGVASATVWRADDPLVATAAPGGDNRTLVTDPGVLELAGDPVTVTVRAEGSPVVLAVGRDTDVTAWVGDDPYARVTGLSDWHTLATTAGEPPAAATPSPEATAEAAPSPSPSASGAPEAAAVQAADPTGSDMWLVEVGGDGSATLDWPAQDGRWSLLAVSLGDTAPTLDLSWPQTVTTPWLWPAVAFGVLLLAVAAILLVRILRSRHDGPDTGWHPVTTGAIATVAAPAGSAAAADTAGGPAGQPTGAIPVGTVGVSAPTRRQIREAEAAAAAAAAERRRGRRTPTGSIPAVTGAIPAVTGATPVVPGAAPAATGTTPAGPGTTPAATGTASAGAGATRATTPTPTTAATPAAPAMKGAAPATPSSAPAATGSSEAAEQPRRGLGARLPWRKSSQEPQDAPPSGSAPSGATPASSSAGSAPAGRAAQASSAWSPTPGASAGAAPVPDGGRRDPGTPTGTTASGPRPGAAPAGPAPAGGAPAGGVPAGRTPAGGTPAGHVPAGGAPAAPTRPAAAGTAPRPAGDDDAASRAQRADAWRRMWGFPAEGGEPPAPEGEAARTDDARGTEEDR